MTLAPAVHPCRPPRRALPSRPRQPASPAPPHGRTPTSPPAVLCAPPPPPASARRLPPPRAPTPSRHRSVASVSCCRASLFSGASLPQWSRSGRCCCCLVLAAAGGAPFASPAVARMRRRRRRRQIVARLSVVTRSCAKLAFGSAAPPSPRCPFATRLPPASLDDDLCAGLLRRCCAATVNFPLLLRWLLLRILYFSPQVLRHPTQNLTMLAQVLLALFRLHRHRFCFICACRNRSPPTTSLSTPPHPHNST